MKRVIWSKDEAGKWNGLILKGRANEVHQAVAAEVARCEEEGLEEVHITDGFNRIDTF